MRRLFSTFSHGALGLGLLLLRVVAGIAVVFQAAMAVRSGPALGSTILYVLTGVVGLLLLVGLWTPVAGTLLAILASWSAFLHPADRFSGSSTRFHPNRPKELALILWLPKIRSSATFGIDDKHRCFTLNSAWTSTESEVLHQ